MASNRDLEDLNRARVPDGSLLGRALEDPATEQGRVEAVFRNARERLVREILDWPAAVGCVAWLTDPDVLAALAQMEYASIIVQKEDFLRPDAPPGPAPATTIKRVFAALARGRSNQGLRDLYERLTPGVRCAGMRNIGHGRAVPKVHHKFLVFLDEARRPRKVWTGSYNFTLNAARSLENAVLIRSNRVAAAYAREFEQVRAISEPLDWTQPWVGPE